MFQVIFSTPGVQAPEKEINDDELIESLKKLIEEKSKQFSKIKELEADVVSAKSGKDKLLAQAAKLKEILESSAVSYKLLIVLKCLT